MGGKANGDIHSNRTTVQEKLVSIAYPSYDDRQEVR
jgi:hypothetical protein